jgi:hypothetical protein
MSPISNVTNVEAGPRSATPARRPGIVDVADCLLYLASDKASFVTAAASAEDGGDIAR